MQLRYSLFLPCLVWAMLAWSLMPIATARGAILINEVYANPLGTDDNREFVELISTTGGVEAMTGLALVVMDSAGGGIGNIDDAYNLTNYSTGANGLLMMGNNYDVAVPGPLAGPWNAIYDTRTVLKDPSGATPYSGLGVDDLGNNGFTLLLVSGFTGPVGTDLDANNDGVLDSTPWTAIIDSVGWRQGSGGVLSDTTYALANLSNGNFTPDAAARLLGNTTPNSAAAWYGGDLTGTGNSVFFDATQNFNLPNLAQLTPGRANLPVPEPASGVLAGIAALALWPIARRLFRIRQRDSMLQK